MRLRSFVHYFIFVLKLEEVLEKAQPRYCRMLKGQILSVETLTNPASCV